MKRFRTLRTAALSASVLLGASLPALAQDGLGIPAGTYKMDPGHGYVTFTYSHLGFSNPVVQFETVDASLELDAENPAASAINVTIDPASVDTGVEAFDGHLVSENWFNVAEHPTATFVSTGLSQTGATSGTLTGDLTIKGITKPVTLDVTLLKAGIHPLSQKPTVGVEATTTILRSAFDLGAYAPAVSDEVTITVSGEFNQVVAE